MKVSVCITTYNGEKFIKQQLASILSQLSEVDEIIISDDGSSDNTLSIINEFEDLRIKVLYHKNARTPKYKFEFTTRNIENALRNACGDVVFLVDQDDIWKTDKVERTLEALKECDLVVHDCEIIDKNENKVRDSYFDLKKKKKGLVRNLIDNSYLGCCMAFNKEILNKVLPFPKAPVPHDIWIGLLAEYYGRVNFINVKLIYYRRHNQNLSPSSEKSANSISFRIFYRILIVYSLVKRILKLG